MSGDRERTSDRAVDAKENRGGAVAPKRVGLFSQRISRNSLVAKEAGVAEDDPTAIDGTKCAARSEEHTSELLSLMLISYAVFCLTNINDPRFVIELTVFDLSLYQI